MPYNKLFIWVEGPDDQRFFEKIAKSIFEERFDLVQIVPYANWKKEKIKKFLNKY